MSKLGELAKNLSTSFKSLLNIETDVENQAENKTIKTVSGVIINTAPNKSKQIMDEISTIVDTTADGMDSDAIKPRKDSKVYTSKELLESKRNVPGAAQLVNLPLQGSFHGLEGEDDTQIDKTKATGATAKDLKKSFEAGLSLVSQNDIAKGRSRSKNSLGGSKYLGSALSLVNDPLKESSTLSGEDGVNPLSGLGVTAKDLRRSMHGGLNQSKKSTPKSSISNLSKSRGSIASIINAPLNEQFGGPSKTVPLTDIPLYTNVAAIINGPDRLYASSTYDRKKAATDEVQSARINMMFDDPTRQPLMGGR